MHLRERGVPQGFSMPRPHRLSALFRPHTTAAVSLQCPAGHRGPRRRSPVRLFNTGTTLPAPVHTDYRAQDKEELTYSTGAAKQREDQR